MMQLKLKEKYIIRAIYKTANKITPVLHYMNNPQLKVRKDQRAWYWITLKALGKKQYALERPCIIYMSDLLTSPHASFVCVCGWVGVRNPETMKKKSQNHYENLLSLQSNQVALGRMT